MNGVIYARYSSDNQREESIEGQIRECQEYAERNDIQIVETYIDRALSAKTDRRPEFQRMTRDSESRSFEVVLVWKLDRFSRNRLDSAVYKSLLRKNGVKVVSATEKISDGAEGIFIEGVFESMAEYYSAELAEKVRRGHKENALKCKFNGGTIPAGFYIDSERRYQIDTSTAPIVLEAFKMYDSGMSMRDVSKAVNTKGLRNTLGGKFTINSMTRLLHNQRYVGDYVYDDTIVKDAIPAIVPRELFIRVQRRIEATKKAPAKFKAEDEYILTTKLFCGKCKCMMVGECGTSCNSQVYRYYKCASTKRKKGCDKKAVRKDWIEDIVIEQLQTFIFNDNTVESLAEKAFAMQKAENTELVLLNKRLADIQRKLDNLADAIEQGIISETTRDRLAKLEAQKQEVAMNIAKEKIEKPTFTKKEIKFWFLKFRELDMSKQNHRRRLVDTFVNAVYLYDDRLVIMFNFKDDSKTVTFKDIEESHICSDNENAVSPYTTNPNFSPVGEAIGFVVFLPRQSLRIRNFASIKIWSAETDSRVHWFNITTATVDNYDSCRCFFL